MTDKLTLKDKKTLLLSITNSLKVCLMNDLKAMFSVKTSYELAMTTKYNY